MGSEIKSVEALAAKVGLVIWCAVSDWGVVQLHADLERQDPLLVPADQSNEETLVFSVSNYVVFPKSPIEILRDGDIVTVSWQHFGWQTIEKLTCPLMEDTPSKTSMTDGSSSDVDTHKGDSKKKVYTT